MRCVHGRSCQGLIECLYMTSSCQGLGCTLGKVENNERRTAAKHNRIHLYLPTAACLYVCVCCSHARYNTNTHTQKLGTGGQDRFSCSWIWKCVSLLCLIMHRWINTYTLNVSAKMGAWYVLRIKCKTESNWRILWRSIKICHEAFQISILLCKVVLVHVYMI